MFEQLGFENLTPKMASVIFALAIGLIFGSVSQHIKFCFRRSIVGTPQERKSARGIWFAALASATIGTQLLIFYDFFSFNEHRFFNSDIPILAIAMGGIMFGVGMVLTRGCISRLVVLTGSGNIRALIVFVIFAITAHATLKGVFAPVRVWIGSFTLDLGEITGFSELIGGPILWSILIIFVSIFIAYKSSSRISHLILAIFIGLLVPLSWLGTGFILFDEFDPIPLQSLSFTSPSSDLLFWSIASTSIPAGFGVGLIGGVILGSFTAAISKNEFQWITFENHQQTKQYLLGAVLMGSGGVLAGGCTVGAGLAGIPTLSFAAISALICVVIGALMTKYITNIFVNSNYSYA